MNFLSNTVLALLLALSIAGAAILQDDSDLTVSAPTTGLQVRHSFAE